MTACSCFSRAALPILLALQFACGSESSEMGLPTSVSGVATLAKAPRLEITPQLDSLSPNETLSLRLAGRPRPRGIMWRSSDSRTATVDHAGQVQALRPGIVLVVAAWSAGADTATIVVRSPSEGGGVFASTALSISPHTAQLMAGERLQLVAWAHSPAGDSIATSVIYEASGGTITATGFFTANAIPGTYPVVARQVRGTLRDTASVTVLDPSATLRRLASARKFTMGAAVAQQPFETDSLYRQTLLDQYNMVVPEDGNSLKFGPVHPSPSIFTFGVADKLFAFAQANGMSVQGGVLVWHESLPAWLVNGGFTKRQLLTVLETYLTTVVGRYAGRVTAYDVVNEPLLWNGTLRQSIWMTTIGPEYIDSSFIWAHRADPTARLYLNDFDVEGLGVKSDSLLALVKRLRTRNIPITGVGFQSHFPAADGSIPTAISVKQNLARFARVGLQLRVSEMDVALASDAGPAALVNQAVVYRDMLDACLAMAQCSGFTTWGFTDRYSWIPKAHPGFGRGLPLDSSYRPKAAFDSLIARLRRP
jgi:endo-1,4-beta-xylanase